MENPFGELRYSHQLAETLITHLQSFCSRHIHLRNDTANRGKIWWVRKIRKFCR